jgi:ubiquinone biosynthesis protein UbiJ
MEALSSLAILAINHLIQGEHWAQSRLVAHSGAQVLIEAGLFELRFGIDEKGLLHSGDKAFAPDVTITLPTDLPFRLFFERETLFSSVKLAGAADIAESLAFVLRNLRWDGEADLARVVGDIPARRLARLALAIAAGIQDTIARVAQNISEYAVEESGILTASHDISEFSGAVNLLRDDVERLEKRISRL